MDILFGIVGIIIVILILNALRRVCELLERIVFRLEALDIAKKAAREEHMENKTTQAAGVPRPNVKPVDSPGVVVTMTPGEAEPPAAPASATASTAKPEPPLAKPIPVPMPAPAPSEPAPVPMPAPTPSKFEQWADATWNWIRVGEEWRPEWIPGEYAVAAVQLLRGAALLLIFGAAWFVRYVHEQGWFSPAGRIAAGFAMSLALVVTGSRLLRRQWRPLGLTLAGLGFALAEFIDFAGANLYEIMPPFAAFAIAGALAIGAGVMAWRHSPLLLALIALFAGYTAPLFFHEAACDAPTRLGWLLILGAEAAFLSVARGWRSLPWISIAATCALAAPVWTRRELDAMGHGWAVAYIALQTAIAWTQSLGASLLRRRAPFWFDNAAWIAATAASAIFAVLATSPWPGWTQGLPHIALAAGSALIAWSFSRRRVGDIATHECLCAATAALSLVFVCRSFDGSARCVALSAAAVCLVMAAARLGRTTLACGALGAWILWIVYVGEPATGLERVLRIGSVTASLWASGLILARRQTASRPFAPMLLWCGWMATICWGSWEIRHAHPDFAPGLALFWSVQALATLAVGLWFARRDARAVALGLFALATAKFLFLDQAGAPTPERVAGFIGVGLLLLLGSAGYIRAASRRREIAAGAADNR